MDLRIEKTRQALKDAICTLVEETDFEKLTVKDICLKAKINRITFYDHYKDKYDLLHDIFAELDEKSKKNAALLDETNNPSKDEHTSLVNYLLSLVKCLFTRKSLITSMSKQMSGYIYFAFMSFLNNRFKDLILYYKHESKLIYSMEQTTAFICNGLISFVIEGIISNSNDISEEFFKAQRLFRSIVENNIIFHE